MSFGFSVGDFVAAAKLIADICSCLRSSSTSEYNELVVELHNLKRALDEIEHLKCIPEQTAAITAVKVTALTCRLPLNEFADKMRKFERLQMQGTLNRSQRMKLWKIKLEWGFSMDEEVQRLRTYLMAHVGSLNMRLMTLGLAAQTALSEAAIERQKSLEDSLTATQVALQTIQNELDAQRQRFGLFTNVATTKLIPVLFYLARQVWIYNLKLMSFITWQQQSLQPPGLSHGWSQLQVPVWLEDALGRKLPIPSEYNWGKVHAIILEQFRNGPGQDKVSSGEYDLYEMTNQVRRITSSDHENLIPGMSITMAMRIGVDLSAQYSGCPNPGCNPHAIISKNEEGKRCPRCGVWYSITREAPPQPFRALASKMAEQNMIATPSSDVYEGDNLFKRLRMERRSFKNMQIYMMDLTTLQALFESDNIVMKSDREASAWSEQDKDSSSVPLGYLSESTVSASSSAADSASMASHKIYNNY